MRAAFIAHIQGWIHRRRVAAAQRRVTGVHDLIAREAALHREHTDLLRLELKIELDKLGQARAALARLSEVHP